ncbi:protein-glutamate O-methyltransferase [Telmatospirillum sp.]|uniref:CheR family methyltransferase n=1 Tax=Telmatospirillum sp. TaxID=2079197 RepID=UPI00284CE5C3|nr:protein-glutamate O-methyltransferase [Telmatospirillum sp.]MDR3435214.1 protein-glutamate O-methyltransferase [Telmatospirillum sp.]
MDFIELIHRHSGIVLTPEKRNLISSRLQKRLKILGLASFGEYFDYLHYAPERDDEIIAMIDEITTNKTAFFREGHHFDFLTSKVLPRLVTSQWSTVNVWSAGCSTGEEPYTLAMVLAEYFGATQNFTILATDLSTQALQTAQRAVYSNELGGPIPLAMRQKYTMTGYRSQRGRFRIVPELRERVTFQQLNLIDRDWNVPAGLNIIFCRNVMIYFNRESRSGIISRFRRTLKSDGYLFIGHSETLGDLDHRFVQVQPTVYTHHK